MSLLMDKLVVKRQNYEFIFLLRRCMFPISINFKSMGPLWKFRSLSKNSTSFSRQSCNSEYLYRSCNNLKINVKFCEGRRTTTNFQHMSHYRALLNHKSHDRSSWMKLCCSYSVLFTSANNFYSPRGRPQIQFLKWNWQLHSRTVLGGKS